MNRLTAWIKAHRVLSGITSIVLGVVMFGVLLARQAGIAFALEVMGLAAMLLMISVLLVIGFILLTDKPDLR